MTPQKNPGMDFIREEFFPRSDPQKKRSMGCTCLTHFTKDSNGNDSAKKPKDEFHPGGIFPPIKSPKKRKYRTSPPGGFPVYSGVHDLQKNLGNGFHPGGIFPPIGSPKKTRGWIPSGRNFSPDRISKKRKYGIYLL